MHLVLEILRYMSCWAIMIIIMVTTKVVWDSAFMFCSGIDEFVTVCWLFMMSLIARFMGPIWGPSGADRTQVGPMLPHELCYLGQFEFIFPPDPEGELLAHTGKILHGTGHFNSSFSVVDFSFQRFLAEIILFQFVLGMGGGGGDACKIFKLSWYMQLANISLFILVGDLDL